MDVRAEEGNFTISFSNLDQFYKECDIIEPTGVKREWEINDKSNNPSWIGLSREKIIASKYCYKEGLDKLAKLEMDFSLGGIKRTYKWDENDGDDMNYDRFLDNLPCLSKRIQNKGNKQGKIVTIYVSIGENCGVEYKDMLNRSYTVMQLVDYLESMNYRTEIIVYDDVADLGTYGDENINRLHTEVVLKRAEDPLIKGLILNCISPWMLRYHMFKFWNAKFRTRLGYGHTIRPDYEETSNKIYFKSGECLTKEASVQKLKKLAEKFGFAE